jgi:hypothetical protein
MAGPRIRSSVFLNVNNALKDPKESRYKNIPRIAHV